MTYTPWILLTCVAVVLLVSLIIYLIGKQCCPRCGGGMESITHHEAKNLLKMEGLHATCGGKRCVGCGWLKVWGTVTMMKS